MEKIAILYKGLGCILRSGGAKGADSAFEKGAGGLKEIYKADINKVVSPELYKKARKIAKAHHGAWHKCSEYAKALHSRNVFQVLGADLVTPSMCLICWTPDGCKSLSERTIETGGTGTAISVASYHSIPIFNLCVESDRGYFEGYIKNA
jgi:hypothetical protein